MRRFSRLPALVVLLAACGSASETDPAASQTESLVGSPAPASAVNSSQFLYFRSNATGWTVSEANRLKSTSDPAVFSLQYQVTQPWLVTSPDQGSFTLTNQLDGYGTAQSFYADRSPSVPLVVPGGDSLVSSTSNFNVKYPSTGSYVLTVNWQQSTFAISAASTGIIGDCGVAPRGSDGTPVDYVLVYSSNLSRWCVDRDFWLAPGNAAAISQFYGYGDAVYTRLQSLFHLPESAQFVYQVTDITGGAHTGSDFGLGDTVTGDAFANVVDDPVSGQPIPGFFGYLLTLHEAINDFTGLVTPGWPSDWWADHRSPFPNSIDALVMQDIGTTENNQTLLAAAVAQHERFGVASVPGYDPEVAMFDHLAATYGGFSAFESAFALVQGDGLDWDDVDGHMDPSPALTPYVIAYLQLGIHTNTDLTLSTFVASGVGSLDTSIGTYTVDPNAVRAIGTAHCSIAAARGAGHDVSTQLAALRSGNYANAVATGGTQTACPAECTWNSSTSRCIARW